ncbi:PREDICTED: ubiquitin-like-specific protease 1A isoform X2 [Camelina sativa]|uniref:Ubiquitin-like-specific protease 1A isoform X2 n=1 Tax=Camelina sativa TaxID=90675 RepID=A0ABM0XHV0_CAMSA|nr:PREDICTED: ubiquitin-like-specific protease 1A isoform X2 [Camelina sativa]
MSNHKRSGGGLNPCENSTFFSLLRSSRVMAPGNYRYPEVKSPLRRQIHGPSRILKSGRDRSTRQVSGNGFGAAFLTRNYDLFKRNGLDLPLPYRTDREVIDVDDECRDVEMISSDNSMESVENVAMEVDEKAEMGNGFVNLKNRSFMVDDGSQANSSFVLNLPVTDVTSYEADRKAVESAEHRISKLKARGYGDSLKERGRALLRSLFPFSFSFWKQDEEPDVRREAFLPLSREEETVVKRAFSAYDSTILVAHENSNIDITGKILRCLKPGEWLNDEVINLYMVLLKEREAREPKKFLKCHFFNTFFFTKLVNSGTGYNYGAVRRWTSMKRLGYYLKDCDKIFIPIHMNIHWTLAVINIKDRKFQYLDSFKGREPKILDALARYFVDEVNDKSKVDLDVSGWRQEFVQDLPMQRNGYDCGMFMLKYIDFYSRGLDLCFTQEQMPYFRDRTAKEILQLKAE